MYLPWVLLGIRSAFNTNLGTSSAEMRLGLHPQLPGTLLANPEDITLTDGHLETILKKLQLKNNRPAVPTTLNTTNPHVDTLPDSVTHVYVRQYDTRGLSSKFVGPFPVTSRPSRSTIEIKVGTNKNGTNRLEIRHISDVKVAYLRDDAVVATRPKRGRPPKPTPIPENSTTSTTQPDVNNNVASTSWVNSRNLDPNASTIDFSVPPPSLSAGNLKCWSASPADLEQINKSIIGQNPIIC